MQKSLEWVADLFRVQRQEPAEENADHDADVEIEEEPPTTAVLRSEARAHRRSFEDPALPVERCTVDNRVFLLGFDALFRRNMKRHERRELLSCARVVASALGVAASDQPIEGYYADDERLARYFLLLRSLQEVPAARRVEVAQLPEFQRLEQVLTSALFGSGDTGERLLPANADRFFGALWTTPEWNVPNLLERACHQARCCGDVSLVALAALSRDPVVMTSLRESVVLYSRPPVHVTPRYAPREMFWTVDEEITWRAAKFVETFNALFGDDLPSPSPENADVFWDACDDDKVVGRCVALAERPGHGFYHWAVRRDKGELVVDDFWSGEIWTTDTYCAERSPW